MGRGRPPKPTAQHKADGTYRKDRHAPRVVVFPGTGDSEERQRVANMPVPKGLGKEAKEWWQEYVPDLATKGIVEGIDRSVLVTLATTWQLWCDAVKELRKYPMLRENQRRELEQKMAYHKLASDYGFTPGSRARMRVETGGEKKSGVARRNRGTG